MRVKYYAEGSICEAGKTQVSFKTAKIQGNAKTVGCHYVKFYLFFAKKNVFFNVECFSENTSLLYALAYIMQVNQKKNVIFLFDIDRSMI